MKELEKYLELSMQGPVSGYLGWQVTIDRQPAGTTVTLSQQKYAIELLQRAGMMDSNPVSTPVNYGEVFVVAPDAEVLGVEDKAYYQQSVGRPAGWNNSVPDVIISTRLDLAYSVQVLSKHMHNPGSQHLTPTVEKGFSVC